MKYSFSVLICIFLSNFALGQLKDSLGIILSKCKSDEKNNDLYEIVIKNVKVDPVAVLHSAYISLIYDPPQRLSILKNNDLYEDVSLHWSAKDTLNDYENSNPNYNAEVILPTQELKFRVYIPKSSRDKRLLLEYINVPNFCFKEFKQAIFKNATTWYTQFARHEVLVDFPK
jgi:hypothetical protein